MLSLVDDCLDEISSFCTHLERLMLGYTCKQLLICLPKLKIPIDQLLHRVLICGSVNIYRYYNSLCFLPIWNYLLKIGSIVAYIGQHVSFSLKEELLPRMSETDQKTVLEFAIPTCPTEEAQFYCLHYSHLFNDNLIKESINHRKIDKIFSSAKRDIFSTAARKRWHIRHGVVCTESQCTYAPRSRSTLNMLGEAILFGQGDFFINTLSPMPANAPLERYFELAVKIGNIRLVEFLMNKWSNINHSKKIMITFYLETLSPEILDLCSPHVSEYCSLTTTTSFWDPNKKELAINIIKLNFDVSMNIINRLFGGIIDPLFSTTVRLSWIIPQIYSYINMGKSSNISWQKLRVILNQLITPESRFAVLSVHAHLDDLLEKIRDSYGSFAKYSDLLKLLGELEVARGYWYNKIDLTTIDSRIKEIILSGGLMNRTINRSDIAPKF